MIIHRPWLIRTIEAGDNPSPSGGSAPGPSAGDSDEQQSEAQNQEPEDKLGDESSDDDQDEDPNGRGGKRAVLADLAKERDKRQAAEQERDAAKAKLEAIEREKMTEQERTLSDLEKAKARVAELEKIEADRAHLDLKKQAVKAAGLPAEMAARIHGETLEDLTKDAKALAGVLGPDRSLRDPSQGQSKTGHSTYRNLAEATRAKLGINERK